MYNHSRRQTGMHGISKNQCFQQSRKKGDGQIYIFVLNVNYKFSLHPNVLYVLLHYTYNVIFAHVNYISVPPSAHMLFMSRSPYNFYFEFRKKKTKIKREYARIFLVHTTYASTAVTHIHTHTPNRKQKDS